MIASDAEVIRRVREAKAREPELRAVAFAVAPGERGALIAPAP